MYTIDDRFDFISLATMFKKLLDIRNAYHDAKGQAVEDSINAMESDTRSWLGLFFLIVAMMLWGAALEPGFGLEAIYERFGFFYPAIVVFATTYFGVFLTSKLIVRPTVEERTDDTSYLSIFSACERRERRSIVAGTLAVVHVVILAAYLVGKDLASHEIVK
ncbi:MAG: hypothetical protein QUS14_12540 [Pyrinomonadaceae bacterium]|nr:hypothetical protein [Pyrinomonadaceae bacterium]